MPMPTLVAWAARLITGVFGLQGKWDGRNDTHHALRGAGYLPAPEAQGSAVSYRFSMTAHAPVAPVKAAGELFISTPSSMPPDAPLSVHAALGLGKARDWKGAAADLTGAFLEPPIESEEPASYLRGRGLQAGTVSVSAVNPATGTATMQSITLYPLQNQSVIIPRALFPFTGYQQPTLVATDQFGNAVAAYKTFVNNPVLNFTIAPFGVSGYASASLPYDIYQNQMPGRKASNFFRNGNAGYFFKDTVTVMNMPQGQAPTAIGTATLVPTAGLPPFVLGGSVVVNAGGYIHASGVSGNTTAYGLYQLTSQLTLTQVGVLPIVSNQTIYKMEVVPNANVAVILTTKTNTQASQLLFVNITNPSAPSVFRSYAYTLAGNNQYYDCDVSSDLVVACATYQGLEFHQIMTNPLNVTDLSQSSSSLPLPIFDIVWSPQVPGLMYAGDGSGFYIVNYTANLPVLNHILPPDTNSNGDFLLLDFDGNRLTQVGTQTYVYGTDVNPVFPSLLAELKLSQYFKTVVPNGFFINTFRSNDVPRHYWDGIGRIIMQVTSPVGDYTLIMDGGADLAAAGILTENPPQSAIGSSTVKVTATTGGGSSSASFTFADSVSALPMQQLGSAFSAFTASVGSTTQAFGRLVSLDRSQGGYAITRTAQSPSPNIQVTLSPITGAVLSQTALIPPGPASAYLALNTDNTTMFVIAPNQQQIPFTITPVTVFNLVNRNTGAVIATYNMSAVYFDPSALSIMPINPKQVVITLVDDYIYSQSNLTLLTQIPNGSGGYTYSRQVLSSSIPGTGFTRCNTMIYWQTGNIKANFVNISSLVDPAQPFNSACTSSVDVGTGHSIVKSDAFMARDASASNFFVYPIPTSNGISPTNTFIDSSGQIGEIALLNDGVTLVYAKNSIGLTLYSLGPYSAGRVSFTQLSQLLISNIGTVLTMCVPADDQTIVFIGAGSNVYVIDISNTAQPVIVSQWAMSTNVDSIVVSGPQAWVSVSGGVTLYSAPGGSWHNSHYLAVTPQYGTSPQGIYPIPVTSRDPYGNQVVDSSAVVTIPDRAPQLVSSVVNSLGQVMVTAGQQVPATIPAPCSDLDGDPITAATAGVWVGGAYQPFPAAFPSTTSTTATGSGGVTVVAAFPNGQPGAKAVGVSCTAHGVTTTGPTSMTLVETALAPVCQTGTNATITAGNTAFTVSCADQNLGTVVGFSVVGTSSGITATIGATTGAGSITTVARGIGVNYYDVRAVSNNGLSTTARYYVNYAASPLTFVTETLTAAGSGDAYRYTFLPAVSVDGLAPVSDTLIGYPSDMTVIPGTATSGPILVGPTKHIGSFTITRIANNGVQTTPMTYSFTVNPTLSVSATAQTLPARQGSSVSLASLGVSIVADHPVNAYWTNIGTGTYQFNATAGVTITNSGGGNFVFAGNGTLVAQCINCGQETADPTSRIPPSAQLLVVDSTASNPPSSLSFVFPLSLVDHPFPAQGTVLPFNAQPLQPISGSSPTFNYQDSGSLQFSLRFLDVAGNTMPWPMTITPQGNSFSWASVGNLPAGSQGVGSSASYTVVYIATEVDAAGVLTGRSYQATTTMPVVDPGLTLIGTLSGQTFYPGIPLSFRVPRCSSTAGDTCTVSIISSQAGGTLPSWITLTPDSTSPGDYLINVLAPATVSSGTIGYTVLYSNGHGGLTQASQTLVGQPSFSIVNAAALSASTNTQQVTLPAPVIAVQAGSTGGTYQVQYRVPSSVNPSNPCPSNTAVNVSTAVVSGQNTLVASGALPDLQSCLAGGTSAALPCALGTFPVQIAVTNPAGVVVTQAFTIEGNCILPSPAPLPTPPIDYVGFVEKYGITGLIALATSAVVALAIHNKRVKSAAKKKSNQYLLDEMDALGELFKRYPDTVKRLINEVRKRIGGVESGVLLAASTGAALKLRKESPPAKRVPLGPVPVGIDKIAPNVTGIDDAGSDDGKDSVDSGSSTADGSSVTASIIADESVAASTAIVVKAGSGASEKAIDYSDIKAEDLKILLTRIYDAIELNKITLATQSDVHWFGVAVALYAYQSETRANVFEKNIEEKRLSDCVRSLIQVISLNNPSSHESAIIIGELTQHLLKLLLMIQGKQRQIFRSKMHMAKASDLAKMGVDVKLELYNALVTRSCWTKFLSIMSCGLADACLPDPHRHLPYDLNQLHKRVIIALSRITDTDSFFDWLCFRRTQQRRCGQTGFTAPPLAEEGHKMMQMENEMMFALFEPDVLDELLRRFKEYKLDSTAVISDYIMVLEFVESFNPKASEKIKTARTEKISSLVNQLNKMSRCSSGQKPIEKALILLRSWRDAKADQLGVRVKSRPSARFGQVFGLPINNGESKAEPGLNGMTPASTTNPLHAASNTGAAAGTSCSQGVVSAVASGRTAVPTSAPRGASARLVGGTAPASGSSMGSSSAGSSAGSGSSGGSVSSAGMFSNPIGSGSAARSAADSRTRRSLQVSLAEAAESQTGPLSTMPGQVAVSF